MIRRSRLVGAEGLVVVVLGAALCYGGLALVNEIHGWHEVDSWRRALDARRHGEVAGLMRSTVAEARAALAEGAPLALSADLAGASLVDTDLSQVAAMAGANLYGANLAGTRFRPDVTPRAWLVNATGASPAVLRALAAHGGVVRTEDVESRVDVRIVEGFRAQVAADPAIAPAQRRGVLLEMLRRFYCDAT